MSGQAPNAKQIRAAAAGGPEVLEVVDGFAPPPGPDQIRVRQAAIGVNYIDLYARQTNIQLFGRDRVPGFEAAGVAEAVGANVSHVSEGDRVAYVTMRAGAYATLRTVPADRVVKVPDAVSDEEAAAALIKGTTASYLLQDIAMPAAGDQVVVIWAAGGVGGMLCQWAASLGARVIGVVARPAQADYARTCGAAEVVASGAEDLAAQVKELTGSSGAAIVFDAVGGPVFDEAVAMLGIRGRFVSYGSAGGAVGERDIGMPSPPSRSSIRSRTISTTWAARRSGRMPRRCSRSSRRAS